MKNIIVLTGAGISAESGIKTFRDSNGLWENHDIQEVASPQGWKKNPALMLDFYNQRRSQARTVSPNAGHFALAELEKYHKVKIITQNVDDLHERAGSTTVLHLHGRLDEGRSEQNPHLISKIEGDIVLGDLASDGAQLRPNIVWFGENVPDIYKAAEWVQKADIFIIIGTSLQVYPAAGLLDEAKADTPVYVIDPHIPSVYRDAGELHKIAKTATQGVPELLEILRQS